MNPQDKAGRSFGNIFVMGVDPAAQKIWNRVHSSWDVYYCRLREDGRIVVRQRSDKRRPNATDGQLIGAYNRKTRIDVIEGDLISRMQEISREQAALAPGGEG